MTLPMWPRPQWRDSGARAFYLWFVFGDFADDFHIDAARYRTRGAPDGIDVLHYAHASIRAWDGYPLGGTMGTLFEGENAALFARAGAAPEAATLRALGTALQAAVARVTGSDPATLAAGLPPPVIGSPADFAARLQGARDLFLPGGRVSVEALEHSLELIRARAALPIEVKVPKRVERLLAEPPGG